MHRNDDGSYELPITASVEDIVDAILRAQGRARSNLLDAPMARVLAYQIEQQRGRLMSISAVLNTPLHALSPSATWCLTAGPGGAGTHTHVALRSYPEPVLRVYRSAPQTTTTFGVVHLALPVPG